MLEEPSATTDAAKGRGDLGPGQAATNLGGDAFGRSRGGTWRRVHSLTGLVPLGLFLLGHLWSQLAALAGQGAYDAARSGLPSARWLQIVFVLLPLAFHACFGVWLARSSRNNVDAYPGSRTWMYLAQRATGIVTFAFVVWHVAHLWWPQLVGTLGPHQMYPKLEEDLSATSSGFPVTAVLMTAGVGASSFHFANGVWGFAVGWGLVRRRSRRAALSAATVVLGVVLFMAGMDSVIYFATGTRMVRVHRALSDEARP